jgi:6-phosphogluconolactonase
MNTPDSRHPRWHRVADVEALWHGASGTILAAAAQAIRERGRFVIVLAGGDTPRGVYRALAGAIADWPRWHVWFGDERCVPADDPERNSRMAAESLLDRVPVPPTQIHAIPAELGARRGADDYARNLDGTGRFDLVLLGLGEDGHTASLFPGHDWGETPASPAALAVTGSPKPPPERVSLSAARLADARAVWFLVAGAGKRDAIRDWHAGRPIPAASIRPAAGVDVLLDAAADGR